MGRLSRLLVGPPLHELIKAAPAAVPVSAKTTSYVNPYVTQSTIFTSTVRRSEAMAVPAIGRARDLLVGFLSALPLRAFRMEWNGTETLEKEQPPPDWCMRPDPLKPRTFTIAGTADDLIFHGVALWRVLDRDPFTLYPRAFRWLPIDEVVIQEDHAVWTPGQRSGFMVAGQSEQIDFTDLVEFTSPFEPVLSCGAPSIRTAIALMEAVERFASVEMPSGWLQQTGGEPLTPEERQQEAQRFSLNRKTNTTAFLPQEITFTETAYDPNRLQLVEARTYQSLEAARLMNVPASLLDVAVSSMTYSNQRDQLSALWHFGLSPMATAMSHVLSGPNVTPRGLFIAFDPSLVLGPPTWEEGRPMGGEQTDQIRERPQDTSEDANA